MAASHLVVRRARLRAAARMSEQPSAALLDEFQDALWLEDGLSRNTLDSYTRDLRQLAHWLERTHGRTLVDAQHADLLGYLAHRAQRRSRPSSSARLLSTQPRVAVRQPSWCRAVTSAVEK